MIRIKYPRDDDAQDQQRGRNWRKAVASPHAALALAHHGRRQTEARTAENADRQQFAHVAGKDDALVAIEDVEREQEDERKQIAVDERHLVPVVQRQADSKLLKGCAHGSDNCCRYCGG